MVVGCPKCQAKLKVPDEKIRPEGSKFRCPKCRAMLLVRQPSQKTEPPPIKPPEPRFEEPKPQEMETPPSSLPEQGRDAAASPEEEGPESETFPEMPGEPPAEEREPGPELPPFPIPETPGEPPVGEREPSAQEPPTPSEEPALPPVETSTEAPAPPEAPPEEGVEEKAEEEAEEKAGGWAPAPETGPEAEARAGKILIAHPDPQAVNMLKFVLMGANYTVISAQDGVDALVKTLKERPEAIVVDVRLPKIHGVEVMKRLKSRPETRDIKIILTGTKAEAEVPPIRGAAGYIHQDRLQQGLVEVIKQALAAPPEEHLESAPEAGMAEPPATAPAAPAPAADAGVQRAQRFSRTVIADIELYNKGKVEQSIREGSFEMVFAKEIQEGRKLYEMRIPEEVREKGDFYEEAIRNFLEKKRKELGT